MRIQHAGWPQAVNLTLAALPDDPDGQTAATIERMRELARADARDPRIEGIADRLPFSSARDYCAAVYEHVRRRIRFVRDSAIAPDVGGRGDLIEILIRPVDLVAMPDAFGDCDDYSMLAASLLLARGIPCSYCTVAADVGDCSRYSHVYVVAHLEGGDVPIDASHGPHFGWEAPSVCGKRRLWRIDRVSLGNVWELPNIKPDGTPLFTAQGVAKAPSPIWDVVKQGLDIVGRRYGTPENTYIRQADNSIIARGSKTMTPTGTPTEILSNTKADITTTQKSDFLSSIGGAVVIGVGLIFVLLMVLATRKK